MKWVIYQEESTGYVCERQWIVTQLVSYGATAPVLYYLLTGVAIPAEYYYHGQRQMEMKARNCLLSNKWNAVAMEKHSIWNL